jgi:protein-disulfide isomerase
MRMNRRNTIRSFAAAGLIGLSMLGLAGCDRAGAPAAGASEHELATDIPVGSKDAKVVLVEYASVTCPHCANFHINVMPAIKERFIDTGKVRYVFREFPTAPVQIASAGHLLMRCVSPDKREGVLDALMRGQMGIFQASQGPQGVKPALMEIAASAGMNEQQFDACMANRDLLKILADNVDVAKEKGVTGTPSLFINGEAFQAPPGREMTVDDVAPALEAAIAKAG